MSKRLVQETKSQIAYRQASEAKAASEALKLSIQNTERDNRQSGRDAQLQFHQLDQSLQTQFL